MPDIHYTHPRLAQTYEFSDPPWTEEVSFYRSLTGSAPRKVLDLGCGVGGMARVLQGLGHRVTGVDPAPAMLDVARGKPGGGDIAWVQSPAQDFQSDERFDLILMTGHAFQVLLTDEDIVAALQTMRRHLAPRGRISFDTRNPAIDWATRWKVRPAATVELDEGESVVVSTDVLSAGTNTLTFEHHYQFSDEMLSSQSTLRFTSLATLEDFFQRAGLKIETCYGDWNLSAFDPKSSPEMIFVVSAS
jgi:ubiquinone/menaquinone biosynthesis C-methylase UbiE